jgi:hypothetical protein
MADDTGVRAGRTQERDAQAKALLERTHDPARVLALSDGVFAIIITLLVLEIMILSSLPAEDILAVGQGYGVSVERIDGAAQLLDRAG